MVKRIIQFAYKKVDPAVEGWSPVLDCRRLRNTYRSGVPDELLKQLVREQNIFPTVVADGMAMLEANDVIYVGCAFGKHRSGAVADALAAKTGATIEKV